MAAQNFLQIGYETKIGDKRWAGPVIATPDAIYCALVTPISLGKTLAAGAMAGAIGGAVGGAIIGAILGAMDGSGDAPAISVKRVSDVPWDLRVTKTGPFSRLDASLQVLIISRKGAPRLQKRSWLNNTISIELGGQPVIITHSMFSPGGVRTYLTAAGWPLEWRGQRHNCPA